MRIVETSIVEPTVPVDWLEEGLTNELAFDLKLDDDDESLAETPKDAG